MKEKCRSNCYKCEYYSNLYGCAYEKPEWVNGECQCYIPVETDEYDNNEYTSSSHGDYGPSNPWDAPGMSIRDFI